MVKKTFSPEEILAAAGFQFLNEDMDSKSLSSWLAGVARECSGLSSLERETVAAEAIKEMRVKKILRPSRLVDAAFDDEKKSGDSGGQGTAILFEDPSPWPYEVDGAALLNEVREVISQYCVLPKGGDVAAAVWVLHTYSLESAEVSPILALLSPEKRCGKTTTLEALHSLVARPVFASNVTSAALFRTVEAYEPTLLIDEADSFLKGNEELRGLLNSRHRKASAQIIRTVGKDFEPREFKTWSAKILALIGKLAGTIQDRSIVFGMKRKGKHEHVSRLRFTRLQLSTRETREKLIRWAQDNESQLLNADPEIPEDLNDRAADNWRHMIAIADLAGGDWPSRARKAALILSGAADSDADDSVRVQLLTDMQDLFQVQGTDRLSSEHIVEKLAEMEDRPWPEWKSGKPITKNQLSRLLKPFEVKPKQLKIDGQNTRGYQFEDGLKDAFKRYIPAPPLPKRYPRYNPCQHWA